FFSPPANSPTFHAQSDSSPGERRFQASTEQQNNPPAKGKEVAVDDGILGGLKDILFGTTGPRGGKKDGVVQTMAKSAARQVTNQIVRGMLGSLLGGRKR
ncbi:helicase HerA-like domain-containing protein, partial [Escherichia sp. R-CC3]